ncbi:hypothetical protein VIBRN418_01663 [Vibrio sp. N418]|nr:hypothetical protein VIBRN418_01663 [Vibrio sp. N418]
MSIKEQLDFYWNNNRFPTHAEQLAHYMKTK